MLKDTNQMTMDLSPYQGLYEAIIPQDHILRKLKDNIDFSFVNPMLRKQYCESFGRPAKEPEMMFIAIFKIKAYSRTNGTNLHSPVELQPEMHAESHLEEHPMSLL